MTKPIIGFKITEAIPSPILLDRPFIHAKLPRDLIFKIFSLLNPQELRKSCRGVCRLWHEISDQVPCKVIMPEQYGKREKNFCLETMDTVRNQVSFARVRKFRKVFAQKPTQTRPSPFEIPKDKIFCGFKDHGSFDSFVNTCPTFRIATNGNYPLTYDGIRKIYIKIFKFDQSKQDWDEVQTIDYLHRQKKFLRDVQSLVCEDLLVMCFKWSDTRQGEVSEERFQCLMVQYSTGDIIVDSERPDHFPLSKKLLTAFEKYPFLIDFTKTKRAYIISLANPSEMSFLKYRLDLEPATKKRPFLDTVL